MTPSAMSFETINAELHRVAQEGALALVELERNSRGMLCSSSAIRWPHQEHRSKTSAWRSIAIERITELTLSCAARARVPKPTRRDGCRQEVASNDWRTATGVTPPRWP